MTLYNDFMKRFLDILLSFTALLILSPLLLIVSLLIRVKLGSPILFKQNRPGKHEEIFKMYKFRSMTDERDKNGELLPDSIRLTKFGKFLRSTSIDELPELLNILKGEMSFIGPRPLSMLYLPFYTKEERRRHEVLPGLTGLSQVSGRNNLEWPKRMLLDVEYVDHLSFKNDILILFKTVQKVISRSDISVRSSNPIKNFNVYRKVQVEGNMSEPTDKLERQEIGSDFEYTEPLSNETQSIYDYLTNTVYADHQFTFTGRNAIGKIIDDIQLERTIRSVYLPSYSCLSMVLPFTKRDIEVKFYEVDYKNGEMSVNIDVDESFDLFLFMQYFGFETNKKAYEQAINYCKKNHIPVIEDITHSLLSDHVFDLDADYSIASLRKWFAIPSGGIAYKKDGTFKHKATLNSDAAVSERLKAMKLKQKYLNKEIDDKESFLKMTGNFGNAINRFNPDFTIDTYSMNYIKSTSLEMVQQRRKENAKYLYEHINISDHIQFLIDTPILEKETPLFVPIVIDEQYRDDLRKYLIDHHIYLPVHWPEEMGQKVHLKNIEMSIVCDQRYTEEDMERVVDLMNQWFTLQNNT